MEPLLKVFAAAASVAAQESATAASRVAGLREQWGEVLGSLRRGSTPARLLDSLTASPVLTAEQAEKRVGGPTSSVHTAIERFAAAGVLRPLTDRKRNQVGGVADLLDELDDLNPRIAAAVLRRER